MKVGKRKFGDEFERGVFCAEHDAFKAALQRRQAGGRKVRKDKQEGVRGKLHKNVGGTDATLYGSREIAHAEPRNGGRAGGTVDYRHTLQVKNDDDVFLRNGGLEEEM